MPIRILIVDDHSVVRQGLQIFLKLEPEFEIIGEATNGQEALIKVADLQPDVVLMDLLMPVMSGVQAIETIKQKYPDVAIDWFTALKTRQESSFGEA